ncbi:MAG: hypothetical protein J5552_06365 [Prevotella sp.]|nr:hypothetical protein [Prevotella sp.]
MADWGEIVDNVTDWVPGVNTTKGVVKYVDGWINDDPVKMRDGVYAAIPAAHAVGLVYDANKDVLEAEYGRDAPITRAIVENVVMSGGNPVIGLGIQVLKDHVPAVKEASDAIWESRHDIMGIAGAVPGASVVVGPIDAIWQAVEGMENTAEAMASVKREEVKIVTYQTDVNGELVLDDNGDPIKKVETHYKYSADKEKMEFAKNEAIGAAISAACSIPGPSYAKAAKAVPGVKQLGMRLYKLGSKVPGKAGEKMADNAKVLEKEIAKEQAKKQAKANAKNAVDDKAVKTVYDQTYKTTYEQTYKTTYEQTYKSTYDDVYKKTLDIEYEKAVQQAIAAEGDDAMKYGLSAEARTAAENKAKEAAKRKATKAAEEKAAKTAEEKAAKTAEEKATEAADFQRQFNGFEAELYDVEGLSVDPLKPSPPPVYGSKMKELWGKGFSEPWKEMDGFSKFQYFVSLGNEGRSVYNRATSDDGKPAVADSASTKKTAQTPPSSSNDVEQSASPDVNNGSNYEKTSFESYEEPQSDGNPNHSSMYDYGYNKDDGKPAYSTDGKPTGSSKPKNESGPDHSSMYDYGLSKDDGKTAYSTDGKPVSSKPKNESDYGHSSMYDYGLSKDDGKTAYSTDGKPVSSSNPKNESGPNHSSMYDYGYSTDDGGSAFSEDGKLKL